MAELFGFQITRVKDTPDPKQSFTQPQQMTEHKPSLLVVILDNTLTWKVTPRQSKT